MAASKEQILEQFKLFSLGTDGIGGWIGAETDAIYTLDTANVAALRHTVEMFTRHQDLRRDWGDRARAASFRYDWSRVAARRFALLAKVLAEESQA